MTVGDPTNPDTDVGPLIRPSEVTRVHTWVREAVDGGGELLGGGNPLGASCYPCTVVFDPSVDAKVSTAEIFGPVICVYPYDDLGNAIDAANSLPFAFQAAVFNRDIDVALRVYRRLDASIDDEVKLPIRWEMALDAFAAGKTLPQYLGKTYHEVFEKCRREECDRFHSEVSERDYEWYLRAV